MSEIENNPLLQGTNYYSGYADSIEELKGNPEVHEMDRLIYEVFHLNEKGVKLLELFERDFVKPSLVAIGTDNYAERLTYFEGFKDAFRRIRASEQYQVNLVKKGMNNE